MKYIYILTHNPKVIGSITTPATNLLNKINDLHAPQELRFLCFKPDKVWLYQPSYQPVVRFIPFLKMESSMNPGPYSMDYGQWSDHPVTIDH